MSKYRNTGDWPKCKCGKISSHWHRNHAHKYGDSLPSKVYMCESCNKEYEIQHNYSYLSLDTLEIVKW